MKPILYDSTETAFTSIGFGFLHECTKCFVTEERNGIFECEFEYPVEGKLFSEIKNDRFICVDYADMPKQRFKIVRISKPMRGFITVYCVHCSYLSAQMMLSPSVSVTNKTAQEALVLWKNSIVDENPFEIDTQTDIQSVKSTSWSIANVENARFALGGVEGSILDVWSGEYRFDNYKIGLFTHRGQNRGVVVKYGKNLTDVNQEESIASTFTSVYPFAVYQDENGDDVVVTLDAPYYIDSEYAENYESRRIQRVDFSDKFNGEIPTQEALEDLTVAYIEGNNIGIPEVNVDVSFLDLSKTINYADYKFAETVYLCDTVRVYFEKLGINTTAKVISVKWDCINERMDSVKVGSPKASLSETVSKQEKEIKAVKQGIGSAIDRATDLITGALGGHVVIRPKNDPSEILIMDTDDILTAQKVWRWNSEGWGYSSTGYEGPYTLAATIEGQIVADMITAGILKDIDENFVLNLEDGSLLIKDGLSIVTDDGQSDFKTIIDSINSRIQSAESAIDSVSDSVSELADQGGAVDRLETSLTAQIDAVKTASDSALTDAMRNFNAYFDFNDQGMKIGDKSAPNLPYLLLKNNAINFMDETNRPVLFIKADATEIPTLIVTDIVKLGGYWVKIWNDGTFSISWEGI